MKYPVLRCLVAAVLFAAPMVNALGADYWYAMLGMGYGKVDFYPADFSSSVSPIGPAQETVRDSDLGFTGAIGVQFNRNWAAEVNFIQLGKFSYKYTQGANIQEDVYEVSGWGVSLLPMIPLTRNFSLLGRLGVLSSQTRNTFRNPGPAFNGDIHAVQVNELSFLTGFGAQYFVNRDLGIRIEYQNLGRVGNASCAECTGRANGQFLSANAVFTF